MFMFQLVVFSFPNPENQMFAWISFNILLKNKLVIVAFLLFCISIDNILALFARFLFTYMIKTPDVPNWI